jgi:predicted ATPase
VLKVSTVEHDGCVLNIIPPEHSLSEENTCTVIIGKNGVGKSRILTSIAKAGVKQAEFNRIADDYPDYEPLVIAISTSPFDKFPTPLRSKKKDCGSYRYIGMRGEGMFSPSSAISLISSASRGLLNKILHENINVNFLEVFKALSFFPKIDFVFKPAFFKTDPFNDDHRLRHDRYFDVATADGESRFLVDSRYENIFRELSTEEKSDLAYAISNVSNFFNERKAFVLAVDFHSNLVLLHNQVAHPHIINSILMLMNFGLVRLMDVILHKIDYGELSLKKASSGEQCLIVLMLGIAGHIRDGSLVLIDEPEISLHPRWQEKFMPLMMSSFSKYKNCQFIVATHSPQIVARMGGNQSFILSLPRNNLHHAKEFYRKSADFQLAELFDSPGLMNEYISRIGFNLIAKIRSRELIDDEIESDFSKLIDLKVNLTGDDPVMNLIASIEELRHYYANNK